VKKIAKCQDHLLNPLNQTVNLVTRVSAMMLLQRNFRPVRSSHKLMERHQERKYHPGRIILQTAKYDPQVHGSGDQGTM
jgi:hypothetical protein